MKILHKNTRGVKLNGNIVISSEFANRKEVFNDVRCYEDIVEVEGLGIVEYPVPTTGRMSHLILQGKPNASHMCARIKLHTHDRQKSVIPLP
jgi:hypothetical protein